MQKDKRMQYEGSPIAQMVQATRKAGRNVTSTMKVATITSPPPDIKMLIDNDPIEYDKNDIYVAELLTKHRRTIELYTDNIHLPMSWEGIGTHVHQTYELLLKEVEFDFMDELKKGDRVLVECDEENGIFIIVDRVVSYK